MLNIVETEHGLFLTHPIDVHPHKNVKRSFLYQQCTVQTYNVDEGGQFVITTCLIKCKKFNTTLSCVKRLNSCESFLMCPMLAVW